MSAQRFEDKNKDILISTRREFLHTAWSGLSFTAGTVLSRPLWAASSSIDTAVDVQPFRTPYKYDQYILTKSDDPASFDSKFVSDPRQHGHALAILPHGWPTVVAQVIVAFIFSSLGGYAAHYAAHKTPLLWRLHRGHHSAEAMTVFTNLREHPLDTLWLQSGDAIVGGLGTGLILYLTSGHLEEVSIIWRTSTWVFYLGVVGFLEHSHLWVGISVFQAVGTERSIAAQSTAVITRAPMSLSRGGAVVTRPPLACGDHR